MPLLPGSGLEYGAEGRGPHCPVQLRSVMSDWSPVDCSVPGSSVHGIFQARVLEWGPRYFLVEVYMVLGPFLQVPKLV